MKSELRIVLERNLREIERARRLVGEPLPKPGGITFMSFDEVEPLWNMRMRWQPRRNLTYSARRWGDL